jgi:hypothetical protein
MQSAMIIAVRNVKRNLDVKADLPMPLRMCRGSRLTNTPMAFANSSPGFLPWE